MLGEDTEKISESYEFYLTEHTLKVPGRRPWILRITVTRRSLPTEAFMGGTIL